MVCMRDERPVMIIGEHGDPMSSIAERIRALGYRTLRVKTAEEAIALSERRGLTLRAIVIEPDPPAVDLSRALAALATKTTHGRVNSIIAAGERPDPAACDRLIDAGLTYGLWSPLGDHTLRFQINRASADDHLTSLRLDKRIPTEWTSRIFMRGRRKNVSIYSLSGGGAYLATQRPSLRGAELALDIPLPSGDVSVAGRVLYTNVPGNLHRGDLPDGMAIEFVALPPTVRDDICRSVEDVSAAHLV
jgi:hypothetical protein